ncbi:MAG TPA: NfeD family protein [Dongiaceae bacterium]|nr:NfeD family protein [Dongiaceae bacterium]
MAWWIWVLAGFVLLGLELGTPGGFFLAFFGVAALVVGGLAAAGLAEAVWAQWLLFSVLSVVSLLLFRKPLLEWMRRREPARPAVDSLVGEIAVLTEDLPVGGVGKAELRGASWSVRARAGVPVARGRRCRVEEVDGLTLWVTAE